MSEDRIICRRIKQPVLQANDAVIRRDATDENQRGAFLRYCEDRMHIKIRWLDNSISQIKRDQIVLFEDWQGIRQQQASVKDFWQTGGQR